MLFVTALELIEMLELAEIVGGLKKKIKLLAKNDILVIDELGYLPMSKQGMYNLFQLKVDSIAILCNVSRYGLNSAVM